VVSSPLSVLSGPRNWRESVPGSGKSVQQRLAPGLLAELAAVVNENAQFVFYNGTATPENVTVNVSHDLKRLMVHAGLYIKGNLTNRFRDTAADYWLGEGCSMTEVAVLLGDTVTTV
jgi:hypothetical protein